MITSDNIENLREIHELRQQVEELEAENERLKEEIEMMKEQGELAAAIRNARREVLRNAVKIHARQRARIQELERTLHKLQEGGAQ